MGLHKLCRAPGCDDLAEPGDNRCAVHAGKRDRAEAARKEAAKSAPVAREGARLYGTVAWRSARADHLRRHPLCQDCLALGIVTEAREVDHIEPHRGDLALFWRRANWQSLCKPCHSRKTAREVLHRGRRAGG